MAALRGNDFVLNLAATEGATTYTQAAALRGTVLTGTKAVIDATTKDTNGWAESVEGGGLKQYTINADGIWTGDAAVGVLIDMFHAGTHWNAQIEDGDPGSNAGVGKGATWTGRWQVDSFTRTGELNGFDSFNLTLTSSGVITYAPPTDA